MHCQQKLINHMTSLITKNIKDHLSTKFQACGFLVISISHINEVKELTQALTDYTRDSVNYQLSSPKFVPRITSC